MAQMFVPTLLGQAAFPTLLGLGQEEVFRPLPTVTSATQPVYRAMDVTETRCECPKPKKTWPWLLFVGLGSAAVATGVTVAAIGSRKR